MDALASILFPHHFRQNQYKRFRILSPFSHIFTMRTVDKFISYVKVLAFTLFPHPFNFREIVIGCGILNKILYDFEAARTTNLYLIPLCKQYRILF